MTSLEALISQKKLLTWHIGGATVIECVKATILRSGGNGEGEFE